MSTEEIVYDNFLEPNDRHFVIAKLSASSTYKQR